MNKFVISIFISFLLIGCSSGISPEVSQKIGLLSNDDVVCKGNCTLELERAEYWINKH